MKRLANVASVRERYGTRLCECTPSHGVLDRLLDVVPRIWWKFGESDQRIDCLDQSDYPRIIWRRDTAGQGHQPGLILDGRGFLLSRGEAVVGGRCGCWRLMKKLL